MGKLIKILLIAILVWQLTSCRLRKTTETSVSENNTNTVIKDSVVYRDRIVYGPVDSVVVERLILCPDSRDTVVVIKNRYATLSLKAEDGVVSARCDCDSAAIRITEKERYNTLFKEHLNTVLKQDKEYIEVDHVPWWAQILSTIGAVSAVYYLTRIIKFLK